MTDRVHSLLVVLNKDVRVDDIQPVINAILQLRGVIAVEGNVADHTSMMAYARARSDLHNKLYEALKP